MVTTAHCTFLCKSSDGSVLPNCCCDNVGDKKCLDQADCGDNPQVYEMDGDDAEVICGEWETGEISSIESGEEYNVVLNIQVYKSNGVLPVTSYFCSFKYLLKEVNVLLSLKDKKQEKKNVCVHLG